jgi:hypothetical protein
MLICRFAIMVIPKLRKMILLIYQIIVVTFFIYCFYLHLYISDDQGTHYLFFDEEIYYMYMYVYLFYMFFYAKYYISLYDFNLLKGLYSNELESLDNVNSYSYKENKEIYFSSKRYSEYTKKIRNNIMIEYKDTVLNHIQLKKKKRSVVAEKFYDDFKKNYYRKQMINAEVLFDLLFSNL